MSSSGDRMSYDEECNNQFLFWLWYKYNLKHPVYVEMSNSDSFLILGHT